MSFACCARSRGIDGGTRGLFRHVAPMITDSPPILYIKPSCPWCAAVVAFLNGRKIPYREVNVSRDPAAFAEMRAKSHQSLAPTLDWHGEILADFGVEELKPFLARHGVRLDEP